MPSRTCKVCGEKTTVASKDLKYLHEGVDFICSKECIIESINKFHGLYSESECLYNEAGDIDPGSKCAAHSHKLGLSFRSEYEVAVAEFLNTCSFSFDYEKYSFSFGVYTYTPDFYIRAPYNCFIEVKGVFGMGKKDKLSQFLKAFPEVNYILIPWTLRGDFIDTIEE